MKIPVPPIDVPVALEHILRYPPDHQGGAFADPIGYIARELIRAAANKFIAEHPAIFEALDASMHARNVRMFRTRDIPGESPEDMKTRWIYEVGLSTQAGRQQLAQMMVKTLK